VLTLVSVSYPLLSHWVFGTDATSERTKIRTVNVEDERLSVLLFSARGCDSVGGTRHFPTLRVASREFLPERIVCAEDKSKDETEFEDLFHWILPAATAPTDSATWEMNHSMAASTSAITKIGGIFGSFREHAY
jgi:hypothetical protein